MANTKGSRFYTPEQLEAYVRERIDKTIKEEDSHWMASINKTEKNWEKKYIEMENSLTNRIHELEEALKNGRTKFYSSNSSEALMLLRESLQILNTITLQAISLMGEKKDA